MLSKIRFIFFYYISWVLLFQLCRIAFLLFHQQEAATLGTTTVFKVMLHGLRMDAAIAAYILMPVTLFTLLSLMVRFFSKLTIYKWYTYIVFFIVLLLIVTDLEVYTSWGFRVDATVLQYLTNPAEAKASVSHLPVFLLSLGLLAASLVGMFLFKKELKRTFFLGQKSYKPLTAISLLIICGLLIIPARGGLQLAPLNQSTVYFSPKHFANQAALNPVWNFVYSLRKKAFPKNNPYQYIEEGRELTLVDSLLKKETTNRFLLKREKKPLNLIIIIWESFTEKAIHLTIDSIPVTPHFNQLKKEGIFFSNVYATGDRTNKGIPGILSGYPSLPNTTIIQAPQKSDKLNSIASFLKEKSYNTSFFYGGEPEFANIKSYLLQEKFDRIIGKNDFEKKDMNSKWGAHDGVVMRRYIADIDSMQQPFFSTWLTLSSHEPFETPVPTVIKGNDVTNMFLNSICYTDDVIATFVKEARNKVWWDNTLIIITGDHGHRLPTAAEKADDFRIPMLWLGGALKKTGETITSVVSQLDIATTVISQIGYSEEKQFPFSKNIFSNVPQWAYFNFNDGFGFVNNRGRLIFDNIGQRMIQSDGVPGWEEEEAGKALMDYIFEDFIKK